MTRRQWRKLERKPIAILLIGGSLVVLTIIAINNPWSIISILFVLTLICFVFVGIYTSWGSAEIKAGRVERFKRYGHIRSPIEMGFFTPTEFEKYVGTLYENLGYDVTVTKQSGDGGVDLILKKNEEITAVQVKRYTKGRVGRPEIQRLVGASIKKSHKMIFVTTSFYSNEAREYAQEHGVELVDGEGLSLMAEKVFGSDYIHKALSAKILQ